MGERVPIDLGAATGPVPLTAIVSALLDVPLTLKIMKGVLKVGKKHG